MFCLNCLIAILASALHVSSSACPSSSVQGLDSTDCYRYFSGPSTWFAAEERCIAESGHLASVPNAFANSLLSGGQIYVETQFWIGGNIGIESPNSWTWTDKSPFKYAHFVPGNADAHRESVVTTIHVFVQTWKRTRVEMTCRAVRPRAALPVVTALPTAQRHKVLHCGLCTLCAAPCIPPFV